MQQNKDVVVDLKQIQNLHLKKINNNNNLQLYHTCDDDVTVSVFQFGEIAAGLSEWQEN